MTTKCHDSKQYVCVVTHLLLYIMSDHCCVQHLIKMNVHIHNKANREIPKTRYLYIP